MLDLCAGLWCDCGCWDCKRCVRALSEAGISLYAPQKARWCDPRAPETGGGSLEL